MGKRIIEEQARSQVRSFLDELKNGTTNYRTVASLGDQVAQEYRGRAVLELLQNAHDVLAFASSDDPRRISFVLNSSPEQPELLIANSGRPFRREDFSGICQLGQSPKDPNESVGNKGLGFRSVLELTTRPEVWSTAPAGADAAFTFGFDPDVLDPIARVAKRLFDDHVPTVPRFGSEPVVDWSERQIDEYRGRLSRSGIKPVEEVTKYLSPYVLPRFLGDLPREVAELLANGHVTVIRLPLDGGKAGTLDEDAKEKAVESVRNQLRALDEAAMVFLHHLSVVCITIDGECDEFLRSVDPQLPFPALAARRERVRVARAGPEAPDATERSFHVWSRTVGGDKHPDETEQIKDAVLHLPNRWPEVRKVEVAVSVEETTETRKGVYVVFLPTKMKTTVGAHINAPFYASLDRRQIDFQDAYNKLLLDSVCVCRRTTWLPHRGATAVANPSTFRGDLSRTNRICPHRGSDMYAIMPLRFRACWVMIHPSSESCGRQIMKWGQPATTQRSPRVASRIRRSNSSGSVALRPTHPGCQLIASSSTNVASSASASLAPSVLLPDVLLPMTWMRVPMAECSSICVFGTAIGSLRLHR